MSIDKNLMIRLVLSIAWASVLLTYVRGGVLRLSFVTEENIDAVMMTVTSIPILISLPALVHKFCLIDLLFYIINVFYVLLCYVFFPENEVFLDENILTCIFCVFTYYFVGRLWDVECFFNIMLLLSTLCIFTDLFYYLIYAPQNNSGGAMSFDNMWAAYMILPHVTLLTWSILEKFRLWKIPVIIAGLLFMLSCGTRGPFACLGFFMVVYFFFYMNFKGAIYVKGGIVLIGLLILVNLETILYSLTRLFASFGLSTRILGKIAAGEMDDDSYRSVLREKIEYVLENGDHFFGLGAFGCRNYGIIYPHFLPLDLVCTYGYFLGYLFLLSLFVLIVYALWLSRGTKRQIFIVFLFSMSIIKLFLSNTFIMEPYFYMLIGVCAKELLERNTYFRYTQS